jgi:DNA-directed RNA polymerase specialized sigma24 family protein
MVALGSVATLREAEAPPAMDFLDLRPMVEFTANAGPGMTFGAGRELCEKLAEEARKENGRTKSATWYTFSQAPEGGDVMSSSGEVTGLVRRLKRGDDAGATYQLWATYFHRLVALASKKLGAMPRRSADEEDVALSALDSFLAGAKAGNFRRLEDSQDLWQVLVMITVRKAADLVEHESRDLRDWRRVARGDADGAGILESLLARDPDPAFAAEFSDRCGQLLRMLDDDRLRLVAQRKLEGCTNEEIARELDVAVATVERRLARIREVWEGER